jgi:hypothetical protein
MKTKSLVLLRHQKTTKKRLLMPVNLTIVRRRSRINENMTFKLKAIN